MPSAELSARMTIVDGSADAEGGACNAGAGLSAATAAGAWVSAAGATTIAAVVDDNEFECDRSLNASPSCRCASGGPRRMANATGDTSLKLAAVWPPDDDVG